MSVGKLVASFGKRKRPQNAEAASSPPKPESSEPNKDCEDCLSQALTADSSFSSCDSSFDGDEKASDLEERKPSAVDKNEKETSPNPLLMLGPDTMLSVVSFLEPRETLTLLTVPLSKEWRISFTADQELWRTVCCTEPFGADLPGHNPSIEASLPNNNNDNNDDDDNSICSLDDFKDALEKKNVLVGEYRLIYTSFVRCMMYLEQIQNKDGSDKSNSWLAKASDESKQGSKFPTFGVTKSLKKFLSKSKDRGILKSVIGNGTTGDIPSAPIGVSTDGHEIQKGTFEKKEVKEEDKSKPKYGHSMITSRLWGPTATGVPSHLNLPKSCAIYSIVNWMVAHPNVRGIQTMCIKALPPLLEDEQQRITGRRVGLVEVILCAMLRFPDSVDLHIAIFHAIVLLARPLGGREGMLFDSSMSETTQGIGLTSPIALSDPVSLASRCGGHPSLRGKSSKRQELNNDPASNDSSPTASNEDEKQTGVGILVDSMERFSDNEKLQSMACWALVNVALVPLQKNLLMKLGGVEAILSAMEKHSTCFDVQFRALFALINLAVPCRQSDFILDRNIDAAEATRVEAAVLNRLGSKIARLSVVAMKNFWSSESILNRGCLVIHNLSQSSAFMPTLLETPDCCRILEYCVANHATDRVLRRSVSSTLQRMQMYLDQHPEEQRRFSANMASRNHGDTFEQVW